LGLYWLQGLKGTITNNAFIINGICYHFSEYEIMTIPSVREVKEELRLFLSSHNSVVEKKADELLMFFSLLEEKQLDDEAIRKMASSLIFECKKSKTDYRNNRVNGWVFAKVLYHSYLALIYDYPLNDKRNGAFLDPASGQCIPQEYLVILFDQYHWDARHLYAFVSLLDYEKYEKFTAKELHWIETIALREFSFSCRALHGENVNALQAGLDFLSQPSLVFQKVPLDDAFFALSGLLDAERPLAERAILALANLQRYTSEMKTSVDRLFSFLRSDNPLVIASVYQLLAKYSDENKPGPRIFQLAGGTSRLLELLNHSNDNAVLFSLNMLRELVSKGHVHRREVGSQCAHRLLPLLYADDEQIVSRAMSLFWYLSLDNSACIAFYKAGAVLCMMELISHKNEEVVELALRSLINLLGAMHSNCVKEIHRSQKIEDLLSLIRQENSSILALSLQVAEQLIDLRASHEWFTSEACILSFLSLLESSEYCIQFRAMRIVSHFAALYPQYRLAVVNQGGVNIIAPFLKSNDDEVVILSLCLLASLFPNEPECQSFFCQPEIIYGLISILEKYNQQTVSCNDKGYRALIFLLKNINHVWLHSPSCLLAQEIEFYAIAAKLLKKMEKAFINFSFQLGIFSEKVINVSQYNRALYKLLLIHQDFFVDADNAKFQRQFLAVIEEIKPLIKKPVLKSEASFYSLLERTEQLLSSRNDTVITL